MFDYLFETFRDIFLDFIGWILLIQLLQIFHRILPPLHSLIAVSTSEKRLCIDGVKFLQNVVRVTQRRALLI